MQFCSDRPLLIAVVIVVIILATGALALRRYEEYLSGFWVGDPAFLERAQLRDMQLFVAPREDGRRQGYLIMVDESGDFVANQAIEIRERRGAQRWWSALKANFRKRDTFSVKHAVFEYTDSGPMPKDMKMTLSMTDGTLTLYDGASVYAFLEKDHQASATAIETYGP